MASRKDRQNAVQRDGGATARAFGVPEVLVMLAGGAVVGVASVWLAVVMNYVPEPYLDEIFHIPQAQTYCDGHYSQWDDKITTPPGLYVYSIVITKLLSLRCSVQQLRATNTIALGLVLFLAIRCRSLIETIPFVKRLQTEKSWRLVADPVSAYAVHTGVNIALFPPLFFFSGLYYTDILSTCVVLAVYSAYLARAGAYSNSTKGSLSVLVTGILALTLRQTNIFWAAVFMGGLEVVRTVKSLDPVPAAQRKATVSEFEPQYWIKLWSHGELADTALGRAGIFDYVAFGLSLFVAVLANFRLVLVRLWPYLALLLSFGAFVVWNGGVVLGDKSNHVATIHLPQMLYIWPFFVFFSAPLLYPFVLDFVGAIAQYITGETKVEVPPPKVIGTTKNSRVVEFRTKPSHPLTYWDLVPRFWVIGLALGCALITVHFNTIIHPFTLADNRHYVFYVFRYTIRRYSWARYAMTPIYLVCGWLTFRGLAGLNNAPSLAETQQGLPKEPPAVQREVDGKQVSSVRREPDERSNLVTLRQAAQPDGNDVSFATMWVLATALSLITAPLVEPRYFIIPWVMWRLHVPALPVSSKQWDHPQAEVKSWKLLRYCAYSGHDHRLWLETIWFVTINAVTAYLFIFKGFEWPQEPGNIQRFLW